MQNNITLLKINFLSEPNRIHAVYHGHLLTLFQHICLPFLTNPLLQANWSGKMR